MVAATGGEVPRKMNKIKKINAGTNDNTTGAAKAPIFIARPFAKSFPVTSYRGSNSFIFMKLLYKQCKLNSN